MKLRSPPPARDALRTSADVRVEYDETPGVQATFAELLAMPESHFEPLKVRRGAGQVPTACDYCCDLLLLHPRTTTPNIFEYS